MIPAQPYPWPYDGPLDPNRLALVVTGGQPAGEGEVAAVIASVAVAVRRAGGLVVHVRHGRGSWLADEPEAGDVVVDAAGIDGFYGSPLDQVLRGRGVDTLVLAGYGAETTVSSTLRSANDRGYECLTLTDGVAMSDPRTGSSTLHSITMSGGIFGVIAPSSALLAALSSVEVLL